MYILNYQLSWASFLLKLKWVAICVAITRRISFEHITKRDAFETQHIIFGSNIIPVPYFNHSRACARPISSIVPISWVSNTSVWWAKSISLRTISYTELLKLVYTLYSKSGQFLRGRRGMIRFGKKSSHYFLKNQLVGLTLVIFKSMFFHGKIFCKLKSDIEH